MLKELFLFIFTLFIYLFFMSAEADRYNLFYFRNMEGRDALNVDNENLMPLHTPSDIIILAI